MMVKYWMKRHHWILSFTLKRPTEVKVTKQRTLVEQLSTIIMEKLEFMKAILLTFIWNILFKWLPK